MPIEITKERFMELNPWFRFADLLPNKFTALDVLSLGVHTGDRLMAVFHEEFFSNKVSTDFNINCLSFADKMHELRNLNKSSFLCHGMCKASGIAIQHAQDKSQMESMGFVGRPGHGMVVPDGWITNMKNRAYESRTTEEKRQIQLLKDLIREDEKSCPTDCNQYSTRTRT